MDCVVFPVLRHNLRVTAKSPITYILFKMVQLHFSRFFFKRQNNDVEVIMCPRKQCVGETATEYFSYYLMLRSFDPRLIIICLASFFHEAKCLPGAGRAEGVGDKPGWDDRVPVSSCFFFHLFLEWYLAL